MARMNWEKANRRDRMRRYEFSGEATRLPKPATDKQILTIYKHKMVEFIPTDLTLSDAKEIISAYAEVHWKKDVTKSL